MQKNAKMLLHTIPKGKRLDTKRIADPFKARKIPFIYKHRSNAMSMENQSVRAKVEHIFRIVKSQLYYRKTRYKELQKQTAKLSIMFVITNLLLVLADRTCLVV